MRRRRPRPGHAALLALLGSACVDLSLPPELACRNCRDAAPTAPGEAGRPAPTQDAGQIASADGPIATPDTAGADMARNDAAGDVSGADRPAAPIDAAADRGAQDTSAADRGPPDTAGGSADAPVVDAEADAAAGSADAAVVDTAVDAPADAEPDAAPDAASDVGLPCLGQAQCAEGYACNGTTCEAVDTSGLVGYWRFDEGSGVQAADSSGNGNVGALQGYGGGGTWLVTGGKLRGALSFDGLNNWVKVPQSASLDTVTSAVSIVAWVFYDSSLTASILQRQAPFAAGQYWWEHYQVAIRDTDRKVLTYFNNHLGGAGFSLCNNNINMAGIPLRTWTHVAVTIGGGFGRVFVNGVKVCEEARSPTFGGYIKPLAIGAQLEFNNDTGTVDKLKGMLDEVSLWSRALSETEVQRLANGAQPPAK